MARFLSTVNFAARSPNAMAGFFLIAVFLGQATFGAYVAASPPRAPAPHLPRLARTYQPSSGSSSPNYDEQIGLTFTDTFSSLEYNVTAVAQTNADGYGPVYLLNGLSDKGYWYQVGLSWNWNPGNTPGTGFAMSYEVFDNNGNSVFPTNGQGGLLTYTGPIVQGDKVELSLSYNSGFVLMYSKDLATGASGSTQYFAEGGSTFQGLLQSANSNGFFSGLMTEEYHSSPYYGGEQMVTYTGSSPLGNGFLWADEYYAPCCSNVLFSGTKFVSFLNPSQLQSFARNGTAAYANSTTFITGALNKALLTLSYSVSGGGAGKAAPTLTYVSDGTQTTVSLTATPETYLADIGSAWRVSRLLPGSSAQERWGTNESTGGTLTSSVTEVLYYFHQYLCTFGFTVKGGGTGYLPPAVQVAQGATPGTVLGGSPRWVDAGTLYNYSSTLQGGASNERWEAKGNLSGVVNGPVSPLVTYIHQFGLTVSYVLIGGGSPAAPTLSGTALSDPFSSQVVNSTTYYIDSGTAWSMPAGLASGNVRERWVASQVTNGTLPAPGSVTLTYQHQYTLSVYSSPTNAGTVTQPNLWQNAGASIRLGQNASSGWEFAFWMGAGGGPSNTSNTTTIQVNGPLVVTAVFYPGLQIIAGNNGAVTYSYLSETGTVAAGMSETVYAGPQATYTLHATPSSFLYTFSGWSGNSTGSNGTITLIVETPKSVTASFALNMPVIGGIAAGVLAAVIIAGLAVWRRSRSGQST